MNYHIHKFTSINVHLIHWWINIFSARFDIIRQFVIQIAFSQVLLSLQYDDINKEIAMISRQNIYNFVAQHCRDELSLLTFIQTFVQKLNDDDWIFAHQKNIKNQIIYFFFARRSSQKFLQKNFKMLMMNCTYKINRSRLSLLMIIDQTTLHFIFYFVFAFIKKKKWTIIFELCNRWKFYTNLSISLFQYTHLQKNYHFFCHSRESTQKKNKFTLRQNFKLWLEYWSACNCSV